MSAEVIGARQETNAEPRSRAVATAPAELPADARSVVLVFPDIHGNLRGKMLDPSLLRPGQARTAGLPTTDLLLAVDPVDEPIVTLSDRGLTGGAKDLLLRPDLSTLRPMPWFDNSYVLLGDLYEQDGTPCAISPREVLRHALGALADRGLRVKTAFEFEFRLFRNDSWEPATTGLSYSPLALSQVSEFITTFRRFADELRLGLSVLHSEGAPGLIEVNVEPQDGLEAADTAALLRLAAIEAASRNGLRANFMAKPVAHEEGSSAHVHFSLWDEAGTNALGAAYEDPDDELYRLVAWGVLKHLPAMSVLYNPTINSYKRLVPGYFAPVSAGCGPDDRSFALRALLKTPASSRFELRRPGADCNPYLALAGIAASIRLGLDEQVPPSRSRLEGHDTPLPTSLEGALSEFRQRDAGVDGVLGAEFCAHYQQTREWELHAWQNTVTEWEQQRYA